MKPFRGNCAARLSWWVAILLITAQLGNAKEEWDGKFISQNTNYDIIVHPISAQKYTRLISHFTNGKSHRTNSSWKPLNCHKNLYGANINNCRETISSTLQTSVYISKIENETLSMCTHFIRSMKHINLISDQISLKSNESDENPNALIPKTSESYNVFTFSLPFLRTDCEHY